MDIIILLGVTILFGYFIFSIIQEAGCLRFLGGVILSIIFFALWGLLPLLVFGDAPPWWSFLVALFCAAFIITGIGNLYEYIKTNRQEALYKKKEAAFLKTNYGQLQFQRDYFAREIEAIESTLQNIYTLVRNKNRDINYGGISSENKKLLNEQLSDLDSKKQKLERLKTIFQEPFQWLEIRLKNYEIWRKNQDVTGANSSSGASVNDLKLSDSEIGTLKEITKLRALFNEIDHIKIGGESTLYKIENLDRLSLEPLGEITITEK